MKTLVIGLGNPILTDDGVGVKVAYEVERALAMEDHPDIMVTEASVGGLRLMETMVGFARVILIDAFLGNNGNAPGTVHRLTLDDLREVSPTQHSASAHDTTLVTALAMGLEMNLHLPEQISIYAIEVENVIDFGESLTPSVAAAIPAVTEAVLVELKSTQNQEQ